jgi:hypothetical protein
VANPISALWRASNWQLWQSTSDACTLRLLARMPSVSTQLIGAPVVVMSEFAIGRNAVNLTVTLFNKTATRLPEAGWVQFNARTHTHAAGRWWIEKLGEVVDTDRIALNG